MDPQGVSGPRAPASRLSIVMPTLNEEAAIEAAIAALAPFRERGCEVVVADGGSQDNTLSLALRACDLVVRAPRGRGAQMNAGAGAARGDALLFLHVDTRLPENADQLVLDGLSHGGREWGRFDVAIEGRSRLLPIIAAMMNWRSRLTGIATGDQAMFIRADAFHAVGGFQDIALMEDIAMSAALKRRGPPLCLRARVATSGRRWDREGALQTILLMWRLRAAYCLGADPDKLAARYGLKPRDD